MSYKLHQKRQNKNQLPQTKIAGRRPSTWKGAIQWLEKIQRHWHLYKSKHAVDTLKAAGYRNTDISVLFPETTGTKDFAHEKHTKAPEGAATGAGSGVVVGGTLGWLAGIGALAIPGLGPFVAAGPIMAALAGAGVGGTVGGIVGALVGLGIPEYEAKRYEGRIKNGGILLSVHCDSSDWTKKAKQILEDTGAEDVSSTGEASADFSKSDRPMPRAGTPTGSVDDVIDPTQPGKRKIS
jgi:hypothetical protein